MNRRKILVDDNRKLFVNSLKSKITDTFSGTGFVSHVENVREAEICVIRFSWYQSPGRIRKKTFFVSLYSESEILPSLKIFAVNTGFESPLFEQDCRHNIDMRFLAQITCDWILRKMTRDFGERCLLNPVCDWAKEGF